MKKVIKIKSYANEHPESRVHQLCDIAAVNPFVFYLFGRIRNVRARDFSIIVCSPLPLKDAISSELAKWAEGE